MYTFEQHIFLRDDKNKLPVDQKILFKLYPCAIRKFLFLLNSASQVQHDWIKTKFLRNENTYDE